MGTLAKAIEISAHFHAGQTDKAGQPYVLHPLRLMLKMVSTPARIAAVLHDVVEDTVVTLEHLRWEGFTDDVLLAIDALTKRGGETRMDAAKRAAANPIARLVKLADVEDNMDLGRIPLPEAKDYERIKEYQQVLAYLQQAET